MIAPSPYAARLAAIPVTHSRVGVLGGTTELWQYGPDDADTTIVMIHGFRGDHHGLEPIVAFLPSFRVVLPDLPGFGMSPPLGAKHTALNYAAWLTELVQSLRPSGRVVVLGHSFGSIIVSAAAASGGMPAAAIVLVNPIAAPALSGPRGILTRLAVFYYRVGAWLPARPGFAWLRLRVVTRIMSVTMTKTKDRRLRRWVHNQHDRFFGAFSNSDVVLDAFEASVSNDVSEYAARITPPTLLVVGDIDDITPVAAQRRLATLVPDARLVVLTGVGHLVHYEKPAETAAAIDEFLAGLDAPGHPSTEGEGR